jgi:hypothetical protein
LRGIAQQLAEVYYIVGSQQLDGYGQECFLAKDDRGSEVLIGASLSGKNDLLKNQTMYDRNTYSLFSKFLSCYVLKTQLTKLL